MTVREKVVSPSPRLVGTALFSGYKKRRPRTPARSPARVTRAVAVSVWLVVWVSPQAAVISAMAAISTAQRRVDSQVLCAVFLITAFSFFGI